MFIVSMFSLSLIDMSVFCLIECRERESLGFGFDNDTKGVCWEDRRSPIVDTLVKELSYDHCSLSADYDMNHRS